MRGRADFFRPTEKFANWSHNSTREMTMNTFRNSVLAACVLLAGCISVEVPTDASTFNVEPQRLAHLKPQQQTVTLRNGYPGSDKVSYKINNAT